MDEFSKAMKLLGDDGLLPSITALAKELLGSGKVDLKGRRIIADILKYLRGEITLHELACTEDMCDLSSEWKRHEVVGEILAALIFPWMGGYCAEAIGANPNSRFWTVESDIFGIKADRFGDEWTRKAARFLASHKETRCLDQSTKAQN